MENNPDEKPWTDFIYPILLTYNHKMKSSITGFTPHEAKQTDNHMDVKVNLELHGKKKRKYPDINVGDSVRVYQKKKILIKRESHGGQQRHPRSKTSQRILGTSFTK